MIAESDPIGRAFAAESWHEARELIVERLLSEPSSHWLLTRLATTYYETYDYAQALEIAKRAERIAPTCPLVLWDVAGALDMLERYEEAIQIYQRLVDLGIDELSAGECSEGRARGRGLHADALYRLGLSRAKNNQVPEAKVAFERSLAERGPGCRSIYRLADLKRALRETSTGKN